MNDECPEHHSQYIYHSSAYAVAGEIYRPARHSVPVQGATVLPVTGGRQSNHVDEFDLHGLVSFRSAHVEVGGSYDRCHDIQTSYFSSVLEGLNVADVLTADRVVARMLVYSPKGDYGGEHTFDITGSHFDNLRIGGYRVDLPINTGAFNQVNSYSSFNSAYKDGRADDLLLFNQLGTLPPEQRCELEDKYHSLRGLSGMVDIWKSDTTREPKDRYLCSAVSHLDLKKHVGQNSELQGFGAIICIPKIGVIRLGEVLVTRHFRSLTMFTVQFGSVSSGTVSGGQGSTGGGNGFP
jgi:hypothetical protein